MARNTSRKGERDRATKVVTVRVTDTEYRALQREAEGHATVSDLVRSRILGGGLRDPVLLKQVAALSALGLQLKVLAGRPGMPRVTMLALLDRIGEAIDAVAPKSPSA